jgi:hypothetical protein
VSKIVKWEDEQGRQQASLLPDHAPDSDAPMGVPMLSVDVDELGLPEPVSTNIHNALVGRALWDLKAVQKGGKDVLFGALMAALKVTVVELMQLYRRSENA